MYALFEDAGKFHAGRVMSETDTLAADRARLRQARQGEGRQRAAALRPARARDAARARRARSRARSTSTSRGSSRPKASSRFAELAGDYFGAATGDGAAGRALLAPVRRAALLPPPRQGQLSRRRPKRSSRPRCSASSARSRSRRRSMPGRRSSPPASARRRCASSSTGSSSSPTRTRPSTRPSSRRRGARGRAPLELLQGAPGAIDSPYQFHWRRFLFEEFPEGHRLRAASTCRRSRKRCRSSPAQAFSIDDSQTTEIDDALSVQGLGSGQVMVGIHIAAPALAVAPGVADRPDRPRPPLDRLHPRPQADDAARRRRRCLHARRGPRSAGRLALRDARRSDAGDARRSRRRIERVRIAANLRHDVLDAEVNEETLAAGLPASVPFARRAHLPARLRAAR